MASAHTRALPRPALGPGPTFSFRRWTERFWPEDYDPGAAARSLPVFG